MKTLAGNSKGPAMLTSLRIPLLIIAALLLFAVAPTQAQRGPTMGAISDYLYPHLHNLVWDPADPQHVYATSPVGGWESVDGGRSWAALSPATPNLHYGRTLLEPERRTLYLYRWGDPGLYRSDDFGKSWSLRKEAMVYQLALMPGVPDGLYAVHGDLRLRRSLDGGATWRDLNQPAARASEFVLAVAPWGSLFALVDRQLYRSENGGFAWQAVGQWPANAQPRELLVAPDGALIATLASNDTPSVSAQAVWRSSDGGVRWVAAPLPLRLAQGKPPRIAVVSIAADGTTWAGSDDGRVWRNSDPTAWGRVAGWRELPVQLVRPTTLRADIPYTPAITDIAPGPRGEVLIGTIHGIYRASTPEGPALLRARGLLATAALPSTMVEPSEGRVFFPETGHTLAEPFLGAWQGAGGLATLGFPRSEPFVERSLDSGEEELVQYFERGRLSMALAGGPVSLGRIVPPLLAEAGLSFPKVEQQAGCAYLAATGQRICEPYLGLWQRSGGLNGLGLPLSSPSNGEGQWFERGRIEQQNGQAFLCLIGNEELRARGWVP
jgi:hypothetical protein